MQKTIDKYEFVEKETVDVLFAKFNTEIMDSNRANLNRFSDNYQYQVKRLYE